MSTQIGSLFASLALESNPFIQGMAQVERTTSTTMASVRRQAGLTERAVSGVQKSFSQPIRPYSLIAASRAFQDTTARASLLKGAIQAVSYGFGGLAAVLSGGNFLRQVTTFTELENQLRAVSGSTSEVKAEFIALQAVAERSRSSLDGTVTLFSRFGR